ncbi:voltage-dependent anion-selective channel protein 2 [Strongylocentrotus purpuratus]|uniref:Voltage-dependent anion-selective channel protein 2 n=1 Tax=Strongylocentrotus purpuratus TaxID=7668 RepID=A0A7M7NDV3_STRPU|nr:voltage-dependent anion-selective channel protein 2 [Strongylocentrotus purpuratus]|eukprot:XP_780266.1 PREDICTED: voltage-dependent anion-selective channel protein 2 [Strongylocentrotus purpuratus]
MAVPSSYSDLGKAARDIFGKGFGFGFVKLDAKTTTSNNVGFTVSSASNNDTGKVDASLETKYSWKEYGLSFKEKWNTDNTLATEVTIEDQIAQGVKLTLDTSFSPQTGKKSGQIKTAYKRDFINITTDVDFDFAGPTVHSTGVVGYEGWLAGFQVSFDTAESKLKKSNFALGYKTADFQLHTAVNEGSDFSGSIYQKVNDSLQTAINVGWASTTNQTRFALGAKYVLDSEASLNAKVSNTSQVGIGYTQTLRPGMKITLSTLIDGKSLNQGGHKLGLGLDLEA